MKTRILPPFSDGSTRLIIALCFALNVSFAWGQTSEDVALKIDAALTPIVICSNGETRETLVQAFDVVSPPDVVLTTVSAPRFLSRLEARVGDAVVGYFEINEDFDSDPNSTTTTPTQIAIPIDDKNMLANGGEITLWATPSEFADPETSVNIGIKSIKTGDETILFDAAPIEYRFGVLVRDSGWDGVAQYRIPALATTRSGALLAVYDARWNGFPDLPADIDVVCSRSFDGGKTWGKMTTVMDFEGEAPVKEGVGDPSVLVDPQTGRIWCTGIWGHGGLGVWNSQPGLEFGTSPRFVLCYSDDDGKTWSEPRDITNEAAPGKDWRHFFQGPGIGIALRDGKLVFPAQFTDRDGKWFATLIWSEDAGETWNVGTGAHPDTCEAQVVELNDGSLMLNMRHFTDKFRAVATTSDLGSTWSEHPTSGSALIEPVCQASLLRVKSTVDGDDVDLLAFLNPKSQTARANMTLRLSDDEGMTWSRELVLYRKPCLGYSAMTKLDDETLGVLYETTGGLIFQRVKLSDVTTVE